MIKTYKNKINCISKFFLKKYIFLFYLLEKILVFLSFFIFLDYKIVAFLILLNCSHLKNNSNLCCLYKSLQFFQSVIFKLFIIIIKVKILVLHNLIRIKANL